MSASGAGSAVFNGSMMARLCLLQMLLLSHPPAGTGGQVSRCHHLLAHRLHQLLQFRGIRLLQRGAGGGAIRSRPVLARIRQGDCGGNV
jgi:hypothetical protein